jgi:hypothetical protein
LKCFREFVVVVVKSWSSVLQFFCLKIAEDEERKTHIFQNDENIFKRKKMKNNKSGNEMWNESKSYTI